jgi:hypothetical protein
LKVAAIEPQKLVPDLQLPATESLELKSQALTYRKIDIVSAKSKQEPTPK